MQGRLNCNTLIVDTCSDWSATVTDYVPARGSRWIADTASPDRLAAAWEGGSAWTGNPFNPASNATKQSLKVCTATYNGAQHVGKFDWGTCFIPWGGREIAVAHSLVMAEPPPGAHWVAASNGYIPPGAVPAGREGGRAQYICQADDNDAEFGHLPGKTLGDGCNVAWGGAETHVTTGYYVLATR